MENSQNNENNFFITGTDTDIGKSYISGLIMKGLKNIEGVNPIYYKPISSGNNEKVLDVNHVCEVSGIEYSSRSFTYSFTSPYSPHLASEIENVVIEPKKILEHGEKLKKIRTHLITEGAGGVYVPIIRGEYYIYDLIKELGAKTILVVSTKVGTINHTMLTLEFLKNKKLAVHGVIFNGYSEEIYEDDNIRVILEDSGIKNYIIVKKDEKDISESNIRKFFNIK